MAVSNGTIYEFADFRVVPEDNLLLRNGESIPLPPKAFSTLVHLIEHQGHLVRKEDLIEKIWENSYVEEAAVSRCVWTIRSALGEDSKSQRFIQTVPKCGYKFVADVHRVAANGADSHEGNGFQPIEGVEPPTDLPKAEPRRSRLPILAFASVLLLGAAALAYFLINRPAPSPAGTRSIAVLPFRPINTTNRDEIYEIGIADSLIHQLSAIDGLVVRPLSATRGYTEIGQDPVAAGREQKVDKVLDSSYQIVDGKFRITAQLINVANGQIEDSYKVETAAGNLFAIQDLVAADIANKLLARFGTTLDPTRKRDGTSNEEAYRDYLQGMALYDQRNGEKAMASFDRAVTIDPNYGLAWAGKALAHRSIATAEGSDTRHEYEQSMAAVKRALSLDPGLAEAYSALCSNKLHYEHDFAGAEQACRRALEVDPNSSAAHQIYTGLLSYRGRHDEAIAVIKAAIDLEPSSYYNQRMYANSLYLARRHEEARSQYLRVWELNPNQRATYEWMIRNLDSGGWHEEAFEWFVKLLRFDKFDEQAVERYRGIYRQAGWLGVLREQAETGDTLNEIRAARVNAQIGNKNRAFELLNRAYERRQTMLSILQVDAQIDPLRDDPRYAELVRRIEQK